MDNSRFQRYDGSGRPRAKADREDRLNVRSVVTAPDSSLLTIRFSPQVQVFNMTIDRRLVEQKLCSYRLLRYLPVTPAHCPAILKG
ncbi:uncharacterized protein TNCV_3182261 [Trichonephila clavipes]|uniref:Uncharacterized protein n=1 Tax=Trichonephila clavipes TaxID=2585209 RepID=A0A8X6SH78_TRICX|nr:uncharacterized protein TNCV_3182261 [Trichonephila clavipes]